VEMRALRRGDAEAWRPREPLAHAERPGRQVDVGEILIHLRAARILAPRAANAELGRTEVALEVGLRGDRRERGQRRERRLPLYRGARGEVEVGSEVRARREILRMRPRDLRVRRAAGQRLQAQTDPTGGEPVEPPV